MRFRIQGSSIFSVGKRDIRLLGMTDHRQLLKQISSIWEDFERFLLNQGLTWKQAQEIIADMESAKTGISRQEILGNLAQLSELRKELKQVSSPEIPTLKTHSSRLIRRL